MIDPKHREIILADQIRYGGFITVNAEDIAGTVPDPPLITAQGMSFEVTLDGHQAEKLRDLLMAHLPPDAKAAFHNRKKAEK